MNTILILVSVVGVLSIFIAILMNIPIYQQVVIQHPEPYHLVADNKSSEPQTAVLYGYNRNLLTPNFGSGMPIVISSEPNVSYLEHLVNSGKNPFTSKMLRLRGKADDISKLIIIKYVCDVNGQSVRIPIVVQSYIPPNDYVIAKDLNNFIVDIPYEIAINGNTSLEFKMQPNSKISIDIVYDTVEFRKMKLHQYISYLLYGSNGFSDNSAKPRVMEQSHPLFGV